MFVIIVKKPVRRPPANSSIIAHPTAGKEQKISMRMLKSLASLALAAVIAGLCTLTPAFADYDPGFSVEAESVYFINLDTGKVLYEKDADKKVYPASTTKIMTALLALEKIPDLDTPQIELKLYIQNALNGTGASLAGILRGEAFSPRELLSASLPACGKARRPTIVATGGDAPFFAEALGIRTAPEDFILRGILRAFLSRIS